VLKSRLAAVLAATLPALAAAATQAHAAGDPILPLNQVTAGMRCTGYTVIRGLTITSFEVDVIDVIGGSEPSILVRASGPAVDDTGIAEGFSGSPVKCPDPNDDNIPKTIGAIAQGTGDYGNRVVLVTPIQTMLGEPVVPPAGAKAASAALKRRTKALATPLSFAGVSGPVAQALQQAGDKLGRALYAAPDPVPTAGSAPGVTWAPQPLVPGASVAVGLAGGDVAAGAVGTVTYVDGNTVYAFGHPLDGAGRRSLLLQDAYVYTVINNPLDTETDTSYKLAAPGHDLGTLSDDAPSAVVGTLGALPAHFPLNISATDLDSGRTLHLNSTIADETAVGQPTGTSSLTQVGPVAVAQAAYDVLRGSPARQSGSMCVRITVRERKAPLRFCNTYVGGSPTSPAGPLVADFASASTLLDSYNFGVLHVTRADVDLKLRRDLRQAYILAVAGPRTARRGHDITVRMLAQRVRGAKFIKNVTVHVPRDAGRGTQILQLTGSPADTVAGSADSEDLSSTFEVTLGGGDDSSSDDPGPLDLTQLGYAFLGLEREDGVTASFHRPGDDDPNDATADYEVYRDPQLRVSGDAKLRVEIR
jgi:hypothetical protein